MSICGDRVASRLETVPEISDAMAGFQSPDPDKLKTPSGFELQVDEEVEQGSATDADD